MNSTTGDLVSDSDEVTGLGNERHEQHNLRVLAAFQVVLRVSWIFKTESVIMPAFLDTIAGAGWVRGLLPILNRAGQSFPPLLAADAVRRAPLKKWLQFCTAIAMSLCFIGLSTTLFLLGERRPGWLTVMFLVIYGVFFAASGLNQLVFGTLQGKLIPPKRRGRLLAQGGIFGSILGILCATLLLGTWLDNEQNGFASAFMFTGVGFLATALISLAAIEPTDTEARSTLSGRQRFVKSFVDAWYLLRSDARFRRLATSAMLFVSSQLAFPHYQALVREKHGNDVVQLMVWVVVQNFGVGVFSVVLGKLADDCGNRLAVRTAMFVAALPPATAILLAKYTGAFGVHNYWITFLLLGMVPVTFRTLANYTLEIAKPNQHPRYLSTLTVCMAMPFVFSPVVGWLVDVIGFEPVFLTISTLIFSGALMTFRMVEPRGSELRR